MPQTREQREAELVLARKACLLLLPITEPGGAGVFLLNREAHGEPIASLIDQFLRLDKKEQRQVAAGVHGKKGGRPRKKAASG